MEELAVTVDTSTPAGSVALNRGEDLLGEVVLHLRGTHTDRILSSLNWLLTEACVKPSEVDVFGVVIGPGSFTGLRVGVATVKGLAFACDTPVVGVSSLETLAMACPASAYPVCTMIDARKHEVYGAVYDCRQEVPINQVQEQVVPPRVMLEQLQGEHLFVGSGAVLYRDLILERMGDKAHFVPRAVNLPRASSAAALVLARYRVGETCTAREIAPRYIRASEAEIMRAAKQASKTT
jgi:tRNA threonylcarbamoyladenosine biosynthesis protein TsaB